MCCCYFTPTALLYVLKPILHFVKVITEKIATTKLIPITRSYVCNKNRIIETIIQCITAYCSIFSLPQICTSQQTSQQPCLHQLWFILASFFQQTNTFVCLSPSAPKMSYKIRVNTCITCKIAPQHNFSLAQQPQKFDDSAEMVQYTPKNCPTKSF